jgi:hypothetical protein
MNQLKNKARVAGLLYLFIVLTGPFVLIYVPGKLFVYGDPMATVSNILAHETLFRTYIVVDLISELFFILLVLALYRLLKDVGPQLAAIMAILVLMDAPLAFIGVANDLATLAFARGADFLAVFGEAQRNALAILFLNWDKQAMLVDEMFWGLWLLPLGLLVVRSGLLPRLLGGWLIVNGLAYVALSITGILLPQFLHIVSTVTTPILFGEVAFMLWLLIIGARVRPAPAAVTSLA